MRVPNKMTESHAETVVAYARCDMNTTKTALTLRYDRETIVYRLNRIKTITGLDPRNFFDLHELYSIAREILGDEYEP